MSNSPSMNLNNPFFALKHKNFRLYWIGMCISQIGTWMQNIAQPWLAYSLTKSPLLLSLVGVMQFLPVLLFSLFAGVIVDRFEKKKLLFFTQTSFLIITLALALLVWTGRVRYGHILIAATALGIVNTLDMPTRQSFVVELVGKADLTNAIALNSSVFNAARVLGPGLAGLIMGYAGVAVCFYINSFSFAAVIFALFFIKPNSLQPVQQVRKKVMEDIKDGLFYVKQNNILIKTILSVLIVGTFTMNYNVLVPVFTEVVLHEKEAGFGFLMSFMGIGAFFGAMSVAAMSRRGPKAVILGVYPLFCSAALVFVGFTSQYFLTAAGMVAIGFFFVSFASTANSTLQFYVSDEYRGRVMSVYTLVLAGSTPVGNLFAGVITDYFGPSAGFYCCGLSMFLFLGFLFLLNKKNAKTT